jgi:hypothetical protein
MRERNVSSGFVIGANLRRRFQIACRTLTKTTLLERITATFALQVIYFAATGWRTGASDLLITN